jgi:hypothetical protein
MNRPPFEVADIIRQYGNSFIAKHRSWLTWLHLRVLYAIEFCRTATLGGHLDRCCRCGHEAISFCSCRNRHCPKCQTNARDKWLAGRSKELLPTSYVHVVFTIPHELSWLARVEGSSTAAPDPSSLAQADSIRIVCSLKTKEMIMPGIMWRLRPIRSISERRSASSACFTPEVRLSNRTLTLQNKKVVYDLLFRRR